MELTLASTIMSEAQIRAGQEVIAAVFPIVGMQFGGEPSIASDLPSTGGKCSWPAIAGERMNSMFKNCEVSELVLAALFKEKLKAALDVQKVDIVDHTSGRDLVLTGCIPGDEDAQPLSIRVSTADEEEVDLHDLIAKLGLPEQPPEPEYDHNDFLDLVAVVTGLDTSEVEAVDTTDDAVMVMYRALPDVSKVSGDAMTVMQLSLCGVPLEDLSESDLWTLFYTLEHHGEFHALCTLYRIYELAK